MGRYKELKIIKDGYHVCPYCQSKVEWFGYDDEGGEYQCSECYRVWGENRRIITED